VPFIISDNELWLLNTASLSLANNVVLEFTPTGVIAADIGGVLNQNGTNSFTSFKDGTKLGNTNTTVPCTGDWGGIYDNSGSYYYSWGNIYFDDIH
jgi:hypothetical protein